MTKMHFMSGKVIGRNQFGIAWFGQNSFAIKDASGTMILVDPYFPTSRGSGKFLHGSVPDDIFTLNPNCILLTHDHSDHTDKETLREYFNTSPLIVGSEESIGHIGRGQIIHAGESIRCGGLIIKALFSKIPDTNCTTHLGYIIRNEADRCIFISGDTQQNLADCEELIGPIEEQRPDIVIVATHPDEGEFPFFEDTVKLAERLQPRYIIPAHFGCFHKRTYDPYVWQRGFPRSGARAVIIPFNGCAVFDLQTGHVRYDSDASDAKLSCEPASWCGRDVFRLMNCGMEALVIPGYGANMIRLTDVRNGIEFLHTPVNYEQFEKRHRIYGIPVLFPPNRIKDGRFSTKDRQYELEINSPDGHHCHGFISEEAFAVESYGVFGGIPCITMTYRNSPNMKFHQSFPHDFTIRITYYLTADGMEQEINCTNLGRSDMPFGLGFHTSFNLPYDMASRSENVVIKMPVDRRWEIDERSIPTGRLISLSALEEGYRKDGVMAQGQTIRDHYRGSETCSNSVILEDTSSAYRIVYSADRAFGHWMIWNEDGRSGFICPEPMTWAIDAPNLHLKCKSTGYMELKQGESWKARLIIRKERKDEYERP